MSKTFEQIQKEKILNSYWNQEIQKSDLEETDTFKKVITDFREGKLKSSNGDRVMDKSQAISIAYKEAEKSELGGEMIKASESPDSKDSKQNTNNFVGGDKFKEYQKDQTKEEAKDPDKEDSDKVVKSEDLFDILEQSFDDLSKSFDVDIEKGKSYPIGTIHNGYKKVGEGKWQKVSSVGVHKNKTKQEHEEISKKYYKSPSKVGDDLGFDHSQAAKKLDGKEYDDTHVLSKL